MPVVYTVYCEWPLVRACRFNKMYESNRALTPLGCTNSTCNLRAQRTIVFERVIEDAGNPCGFGIPSAEC